MAAARKGGPVKKVEIALREFHEANQLIHGAEAAAEAERTGPFFLQQNGEIFAARYVRLLRIGLDLCEVTQVLQTFLGHVHTNGVKNISRGNEHFTTDDLVLCARVALDIDPIDKRAVAFLDLVSHIDQCRTGRRAFRQNHQIDVPAAAVRVGHCFCVIAQLLRRINAAFLHF